MTLLSNRIGDNGQRYEITCFGYPKPDVETVIGWTETMQGVQQMMRSMSLAPGASSVTVRDRWDQTPEWPGGVYRLYCGGVLR